VLAELDRLFVEDDTDRWVLVTGGPGMGKSAILAKWLLWPLRSRRCRRPPR
jgi:hypothetical protein